MASNIESDGKTVTVTTDGAPDRIRDGGDWADGVPPASVEIAVRGAKADAEAYVAQHHPSKPDEARAAKEDNKGIGGALKDVLGLP